MTGHRKNYLSLALLTLGVASLALFLGCGSPGSSANSSDQNQQKKRDLVIWGIPTGVDAKGIQGVFDEFERRHPDINLRVLSMGAGGMNSQKLMTSIVGNVAPDLVNQDRFEISDWASRNAFLPLDDLLKRDANDPLCPKESQYYAAPWAEASFGGHVYGIPTGADNRVLYYNKQIFEENAAGLKAAGLDPSRPPRTWSETLAYSKVLTRLNPDGTLKVAGYIPNYGNSWLYLYAFQNETLFMSPDGKKCTLDTPESEQALQFMKEGYDLLGGYNNAQSFQSAFQSKENDPFMVGKVAMKVDGDWIDDDLARYAPNLNFGTAPAPVPDDRYNHVGRFKNVKDTFITWVGGFAYVIPRGAKHVEDAWDFIKFATSTEGRLIEARTQQKWDQAKGRMYIPKQLASREANERLLKEFAPADPRFRESLQSHVSVMSAGRNRPSTFVGNLLWQEHVKATDNALSGTMSIKQALVNGQQAVQHDLDAYYYQDRYPVIDLSKIVYVVIGLVLIAIVTGVIWFRNLKLGRMARSEAKWAYLFVSPWVVGFLVFTFGPMVASLFFSLTQYNVLQPARFVGINNYADMFGSDKVNVVKAFSNAAYLAGVGVPLSLLTGLAIALLLNTAVRGMRLYRTFFYMPAIVPAVASAVLWAFILSPDPMKGIFNSIWNATLLPWLHLPLPGWISAEAWAKPSLIMMGMWGAGSGMVLWLAGLKGVSNTLYEAASIDGASPNQQFISVTVPMLSPVIFFNVVMGFIGALQEFDRVFVLKTNDGPVGPAESLLVPVYHLFDNGFSFFRMGYASALAWAIFVVILALTLFQFRLAPRWVHYEADK